MVATVILASTSITSVPATSLSKSNKIATYKCTSSFFGCSKSLRNAPKPKASVTVSRSNGSKLCVVAFKENEKITDWRVQQMVDLTHKYFVDFLSKGDEDIAEDLFDDQVVHKDMVWDPAHPTVGVLGMQHYLHDIKAAFPDFTVRIEQIAQQDTNSIWVKYEGSATGLGEYHGHKPSHHNNLFSGVNIIKFTHDRSRIAEVEVYRSAFAEDKTELGERELFNEGGFRELRLKRLV